MLLQHLHFSLNIAIYVFLLLLHVPLWEYWGSLMLVLRLLQNGWPFRDRHQLVLVGWGLSGNVLKNWFIVSKELIFSGVSATHSTGVLLPVRLFISDCFYRVSNLRTDRVFRPLVILRERCRVPRSTLISPWLILYLLVLLESIELSYSGVVHIAPVQASVELTPIHRSWVFPNVAA